MDKNRPLHEGLSTESADDIQCAAHIESCLESLEAAIHNLSQRLEPCLTPADPQTCEGEKDSSERHSSAYVRFVRVSSRINDCRVQIEDLQARFDL